MVSLILTYGCRTYPYRSTHLLDAIREPSCRQDNSSFAARAGLRYQTRRRRHQRHRTWQSDCNGDVRQFRQAADDRARANRDQKRLADLRYHLAARRKAGNIARLIWVDAARLVAALEAEDRLGRELAQVRKLGRCTGAG